MFLRLMLFSSTIAARVALAQPTRTAITLDGKAFKIGGGSFPYAAQIAKGRADVAACKGGDKARCAPSE